MGREIKNTSLDDVPEKTVFKSIPNLGHQDADGHARRHDARFVDAGCTCVKAVGIGEENMPSRPYSVLR